MDVLLSFLVQLVTGATGGNVSGQIAPRLDLGPVGNALVGALGGVAATMLVLMIPTWSSLVDATLGAPGVVHTVDLGALAGQGAVSLIGGSALTAVVGAVKSALAKSGALR